MSSGVACDLSIDMFRMRTKAQMGERVAAAAENLPFFDGQFDGDSFEDIDNKLDDDEAILACVQTN